MSRIRYRFPLFNRFLYFVFFTGLIVFGGTSFQHPKVGAQGSVQSCSTCRPPTAQIIYSSLIE